MRCNRDIVKNIFNIFFNNDTMITNYKTISITFLKVVYYKFEAVFNIKLLTEDFKD